MTQFHRFYRLFLLMLLSIALSWPWIRNSLRSNILFLQANSQLINKNLSEAGQKLYYKLEESGGCRDKWMAGVLANNMGWQEQSRAAWKFALACHPYYTILIHSYAKDDLELATYALEIQPGSAEAWFWYGDLYPELRLAFYEKGLALDPSDGVHWVLLGNMLRKDNPSQALQAYIQACYNGDPGSNGCYNAGRMAEKLGDIPSAIRYYRLSRFEKSLLRADELEREINRQNAP